MKGLRAAKITSSALEGVKIFEAARIATAVRSKYKILSAVNATFCHAPFYNIQTKTVNKPPIKERSLVENDKILLLQHSRSLGNNNG